MAHLHRASERILAGQMEHLSIESVSPAGAPGTAKDPCRGCGAGGDVLKSCLPDRLEMTPRLPGRNVGCGSLLLLGSWLPRSRSQGDPQASAISGGASTVTSGRAMAGANSSLVSTVTILSPSTTLSRIILITLFEFFRLAPDGPAGVIDGIRLVLPLLLKP